jgi:branched-chain amino acid transport system ATP-binding protein
LTARDGSTVLRVEHLTMRFGGLVAVDDLSFDVQRGTITALIGPNGAGKTTVFNCITGFYRPTEGRLALQRGDPAVWQALEALTDSGQRGVTRWEGALFLLERMPDYLVAQQARVARTFQNIRLFAGMTVLENLLVAQHNPLMLASGYTVLGLLGLPPYAAAGTGSSASICSTGPMIRPVNCLMARSGGSKSPAPCAPIRYCCASTSRLPG